MRFVLALSIKAVASENSWPALIFNSAAVLRSHRYTVQLVTAPGLPPGGGKAPAPSQGLAGCFCYVHGMANLGCWFLHDMPPSSLSTRTAARATRLYPHMGKTSSYFCFYTRKWVSPGRRRSWCQKEDKKAREEVFEDHKHRRWQPSSKGTGWYAGRSFPAAPVPGRTGSPHKHQPTSALHLGLQYLNRKFDRKTASCFTAHKTQTGSVSGSLLWTGQLSTCWGLVEQAALWKWLYSS